MTEAFGPEFYEIYTHHQAGDLDHFIIMMFLNDEYNEMDLREIPGFDFDLFKMNMDNLDYDAWYLEEVQLEMLFAAIYGGQTAFDSYLTVLEATAPQTVKVFEAFKDENFCRCLLEEDIQLGNYQSHPTIKAPLSN